MNDRNTEQQLRYLGEVSACLYRAGFETTQMQKLIQERVKNLKPQQETMKAPTPALELLAGRYGLAAGKELDGNALADAILHDDSLYEDRAAEMGISPEMARRLDRMEYLEKMLAERDRETEQERQVREHMAGLKYRPTKNM